MEHQLPLSVSIIILYYNGVHYLKACLNSIINTVRDADEIIVFVNNQDKNAHNIDLYKGRVKYVHEYETLGYSKAANKAIEYTKNDYVILIKILFFAIIG